MPAYNEEKTVAKVVNTLLKNEKIDEVICINDGSTDNTGDVLKTFGDRIVLIDLKTNKGKGYGMVQAILKAKGNLLLFLDADFVNLTQKHIDLLLNPVMNEGYRVSMGYLPPLKEGKKSNLFESEITGQRVYYRKDLLPHLEKISKSRFGVEIYLNEHFPKSETKKSPLVGLKSLYKHEKFTTAQATKEYMKEGTEILKAMGRNTIARTKKNLTKKKIKT